MDLKDRTRWAINFISKKEKLSNPKIGELIGIKSDTVNGYRSKLASPKVDFIVKFCDTFGIDLLWFTKGEGEPFKGASANYPEVCSPSKYETQEDYSLQISSSSEADFSLPTSLKKGSMENYVVINSTEKSLVTLCHMIGFTISRGWKSALAEFLDITPAQISNSIARNRISKNLRIKIEEKGFPSKKWFYSADTDDISGDPADDDNIAAEISFQKLALSVGVKIDNNWILNLSNVLETDPWQINMCIHNDHIDSNMLHIIETKGYGRQTWAVKRNTDSILSIRNIHSPKNTELLKIADTILNSGTSHAASLASIIISLSTAINADNKIS